MTDKYALVVDDDPSLLEAGKRLIRQMLGEEWEIRDAKSPEEALRIATADAPGLILTDMFMPDMNGWELIQAIHAHYGDQARIPAIIWSGRASEDPEEMQEAANAGVPCLPKPCDPITLRSIINCLLR